MANDDFWKEDSEEQLYIPVKSKRTAKTKKMEYDGWGSKPLIKFLKHFGKETEKKISQQDLASIVNEYVSKEKLNDPVKKKRVLCDEWLRSLFKKKFVLRMRIHDLLFPHLAENRDESEDEDSDNSEEENETTASRKRKASTLGKQVTPNLKKVPETPKSCFASIIPENIKLVYLRRSIVLELLKDPETFENKVVGSYVRIKSDPHDYSQKNSHQLLQVTGVRKAPEFGDVNAEYFLQVPHLIKEIPVSMLSNENFKTEECEDLLQRIIAGSANRPTVVELQQKAQILHEVITKQWLARELSLLQNLIDRANEKGWRRELFEYLERKEMLQKPSEQERLLLEVPNVIAEQLEPEAIVQESAEDEKNDSPFDAEADKSLSNDNFYSTDAAEQPEAIVLEPADAENNNICSPQLTIAGTWADIPFDTEADKPEAILQEPAEDEKNNSCLQQLTITRTSADMPSDTKAYKSLRNKADNNFCSTNAADVDKEGNRTYSNHTTFVKETNGVLGVAKVHKLDINMASADVDGEGNGTYSNGTTFVKGANGMLGVAEVHKLDINMKDNKPATDVIELSDDDDDDDGCLDLNDTSQTVDHPESKLWYYTDPQQLNQGPFSMATLKRWKEQLYFPPGFMIWKSGHSPVLLEDMISLIFPS